MSFKPQSFTRACTLAAMAAPLALVVIFLVAVNSKPGFDPLWSYFSLLSLGESRWLGFVFFGVAASGVTAFAAALSRFLPRSRTMKAAAGLLYAAAACLVLSIFIDIDHVGGVWTLKRMAHWSIIGLILVCFVSAAYLVTRGLNKEPTWHGVHSLAVIIATVTFIAAGALAVVYHKGLVALLERLFLSTGIIWVEAMSVRILQLSGSQAPVPPSRVGEA